LIRRNPAADAELEERRLILAVEANVLTDYVLDNGMGMIDSARMDKAIMQLGETYEYTNANHAALYFTDEFLPVGGFSRK
jgi:NitT/TauT family transport system substrate-binding protein